MTLCTPEARKAVTKLTSPLHRLQPDLPQELHASVEILDSDRIAET
jgi:hypothetical protein